MSKIDLSVIIPVYNTENYLARCLDSVLGAVKLINKKVEILVINDGSKGNTDLILSKYLESYKDIIKYFKKENSGLGDTKNYGIKRAKGEYISFIDSDDYVDEMFFKDAFEAIENDNADVVVCDWEAVDSIADTKNHRVHAKNPKIDDDKWGCIEISIMPSSCNKVIKTEYFRDIDFPKGLRYEDLATTLVILLQAKNIVYIPKMNYKYFLTPNSIMRAKFDEKKFQMIDIFEILFKRIAKLDINEEDKQRAFYSAYYWRLYLELLLPISKERFKERYRYSKIFCKRINKINREVNKNIFFIKREIKSNNIFKRLYIKLIHFSINNEHPFLLSFIIKPTLLKHLN